MYDWAVEQNQRRHAGETFDPDFCSAVPRAADGTVRLDSEIFVQTEVAGSATEAPFVWRERAYSVHIPAERPLFVEIVNLARGRLWLVVRRHRSWWRRLLGAPGAEAPLELTRRALPLPGQVGMM